MLAALLFIGSLIALMVAIVAIAIWSVKYAKKARQNFEQLATRLGLAPVPLPAGKKFGAFDSLPSAAGEFRGRATRLFSHITGFGKNRVTWTAVSVAPHASTGFTFELSRQGLESKISEFFGATEITIGNPSFDAAWFIRTNQPDFLRTALLPEIQARISALLIGSDVVRRPSFKLDAGTLVYAEAGDFGSEPRCVRLAAALEILIDLAAIAEVFAQQNPPPDR